MGISIWNKNLPKCCSATRESPGEQNFIQSPQKNKVFLDHIFKSLLKLLGTYFNLKFLRGVHVYDP